MLSSYRLFVTKCVPSSKVKQSKPTARLLKVRTTFYSETSVTKHQCTPRKFPEERRPDTDLFPDSVPCPVIVTTQIRESYVLVERGTYAVFTKSSPLTSWVQLRSSLPIYSNSYFRTHILDSIEENFVTHLLFFKILYLLSQNILFYLITELC